MDIPSLALGLGVPGPGDAWQSWWDGLEHHGSDEAVLIRGNAVACDGGGTAAPKAAGAAASALTAVASTVGATDRLRQAGWSAAYGDALFCGRQVLAAEFSSGVGHVIFRSSIINWARRSRRVLPDPIRSEDVAEHLSDLPAVWLTDRAAVDPATHPVAGFAHDVCDRLGLDYPPPDDDMAVLLGAAPGVPLAVPTFWDSKGYPCWGAPLSGESTGRSRALSSGSPTEREVVVRWEPTLSAPIEESGAVRWFALGGTPHSSAGLAARAGAARGAP